MATLDRRDYSATSHHNHDHVIASGADSGKALVELLGRSTRLNGGRGGMIHLSEAALGFNSTSGIVRLDSKKIWSDIITIALVALFTALVA
jgi:pyruvate dehydrogenase E1 component alpha subunit